MRLTVSMAAAVLVLVSGGQAFGQRQATSPDTKCDALRITAWKQFTACVNAAVAKEPGYALGTSNPRFDEFGSFAKCRHAYFPKWMAFQANKWLQIRVCTNSLGLTCSSDADCGGFPCIVHTSQCIGNRFTDNGNGTVTDNLTALVWEKKDHLDGTQNLADPHDADNGYAWSALSTNEDGPAFTSFLPMLNDPGMYLGRCSRGLTFPPGPSCMTDADCLATNDGSCLKAGFAGSSGWRLPTLAELQTIVLDFPCTGTGASSTCTCSSHPCIDPIFDSQNTHSFQYWSGTGNIVFPDLNAVDPPFAWFVDFNDGGTNTLFKAYNAYVRAVHGGF